MKCVLFQLTNTYRDIELSIIAHMQKQTNTRFIFFVEDEREKTRCKGFCRDIDNIIVHGEIEKKSNVLNLQPNLTNVAQRFEGKYNINYFLDIIQQDQHVYEQYIPYAADHVLRKPKMHWDKLIAQISFYFDFAEKFFKDNNVDMVIMRPGCRLLTVLIHVATKHGIPTTYLKPTGINTDVYWAFGPYSDSKFLKERCESLSVKDHDFDHSVFSNTSTKNRFERLYRASSFASLFISLFMVCFHSIRSAINNGIFSTSVRPNRIVNNIRTTVETWFCARTLNSLSYDNIDDIAVNPYIAFFLPQEPEYGAQSLSRSFSNSFAIVHQFSLAMPIGVSLVVKEHARVGWRCSSYYKKLASLPNVKFCSLSISAVDLMKYSSAVATISGKTAVEATLLGKKSIIFADHESYDFLDSVHKVSSLCSLSETIRKVLGSLTKKETAKLKESGISYIEAVKSCSFDASGSTLFGEKNMDSKKGGGLAFQKLNDLIIFFKKNNQKNSINQ